MEGYDVIQLMHMHSVHPLHYKETMSKILFDIFCLHTPVYPKITCDKFYDCTFFLHSIQLHKHFQTPRNTHYICTPMLLCGSTHVHIRSCPACGFVIVPETLHIVIDNFKSSLPHVEFSRLKVSPLLQYWNNCMRPSSGIPITMLGKQYLELHFSEVDKLCQWILDMRAEHEKGYKRRAGKLTIAHNPAV